MWTAPRSRRRARRSIKLLDEHKRRRRLKPGEGDALLAACAPQLRAIVEAALETGCRRGELLSLQWQQLTMEGRAGIFLPAQKTKTKTDRTVPISARLMSILEMRNGPDDKPLPLDAHVFGNEVGEAVKGFKRAWERSILRANGVKPTYVVRMKGEGAAARKVHTAVLAPESRQALRAIDLHFHDLRREAGSRWLEGGVPLHTVRDWLGHANISQTSTYLESTIAGQHDAMRLFDQRRGLQSIATGSETGVIQQAESAKMGESRAQESSTKPH